MFGSLSLNLLVFIIVDLGKGNLRTGIICIYIEEAQSQSYRRSSLNKKDGVILEVAANMVGGEDKLEKAVASGRVTKFARGKHEYYIFNSMTASEGYDFEQTHQTEGTMAIDAGAYAQISAGLSNMEALMDDDGPETASAAGGACLALQDGQAAPSKPSKQTETTISEVSAQFATSLKDLNRNLQKYNCIVLCFNMAVRIYTISYITF